MSAYASTYERPANPGRFLFVLVLALALAGIAYMVVQGHAVANHGKDALAVRDCLNKNGPAFTFQRPSDGYEFRLCQLPDNRWGLQIVKWAADLGDQLEVTSFVPKDGSWTKVIEYLIRQGISIP